MSAHTSKRDRVVSPAIQYECPGSRYPEERFELGRRTEFLALLAEMARYLRKFAISQKEYDVCTDVVKGKRLSIAGLDLLVGIAARADKPMVIEDTIRRAIIDRLAAPQPPCPFDASESEQQVNEPLNLAQLVAHREKSPTRWIQVAELASEQERASRVLKEAAWFHVRRTA